MLSTLCPSKPCESFRIVVQLCYDIVVSMKRKHCVDYIDCDHPDYVSVH
jgi:hypothetical protein